MEQKQPQPLTPPEVINPDLDIEFMEEITNEYKEEIALVEEAVSSIPELIKKINEDNLIPTKIRKLLSVLSEEFTDQSFIKDGKYQMPPYETQDTKNEQKKEKYKDDMYKVLTVFKSYIEICENFKNENYTNAAILTKNLINTSEFNRFRNNKFNIPEDGEIEEFGLFYAMFKKIENDPNFKKLKATAETGDATAITLLKKLFETPKNI